MDAPHHDAGATTGPRAPGTPARSGRRATITALTVVAAAVTTSLAIVTAVALPVVQAAGTPDITLTKTAAARTVIGDDTAITLRACNPSGPGNGYNLSLRDIVPAGLALVSASPAPTRTVANQPAAGQTTLIWENVSDLLLGSCSQVTYQLDTNADNDLVTNPVGSTFGSIGGAYVSSDPFAIPDFGATGLPTTDITGSDTDGPTTTTIVAFAVEKSAAGAGENELLRGVHGGRATLYTVRVRNNLDATTDSLTVVDDLPAELEFLGCASYTAPGYDVGIDNTVDAPTNEQPGDQTEEYPGAGPLAIEAAALSTCIEPSSIATQPDGTTRVTWSTAALGAAASMAPGGELLLTYLAGVPLRANTDSWPAGEPIPTSLRQGRNLDNNSGAPTSETTSEPAVTNTVDTTGVFRGPSATGPNPTLTESASTTLTAEDVVIRKAATGQVVQGTVVTTTLTVQTGEYRDTTDIVVTDTLPDGLCPLAMTPLSGDADCGAGADPTIDIGGGPVAAPYASATENADGTWTLVWDAGSVPGLAALASDSALEIVFHSRVRTHYQQNGSPATAVLAHDTLTNTVSVSALDHRRPVIDATVGDPEPDGEADSDGSSATITGVGLTIDKRVSERSGALASGSGLDDTTVGDTCRDGVGITWAEGDPTPVTGFRPGDYVCFELVAAFPADIDAAGVEIQDFLPAAFAYVANSARRVTSGPDPDTLPGTTFVADTAGVNDSITFAVNGTGQVPSSGTGQRFRWTIAAELMDPSLSVAQDVNANLMKATSRNTAGDVFQARDQAAAVWSEPQLRIDKTNGAIGPQDAGDTVTFTVRVWNDGNTAATDAVVWDRLPAGITCADVVGSTPAATCAAGVLEWDAADLPTIAAGTTIASAATLTYDVDLPDTVDPGRTYTNTAGVRRYEAPSNGAVFEYVPASNIDPSLIPNTLAAHDTSSFTVRAVTVAKTQQSSVNESGNGANGTPSTSPEFATIGELITYTITATVPEGTTVVDARFTDALDGDLVLAAPVTWEFNGVIDDTAWELDPSSPAVGATGTVRLDHPGTYTNAAGSGDDTLVVTVVGRVADQGGTVAGSTISNVGTISWLPDPALGTTRVSVNSTSVTATVVEPSITAAKTEDDTDNVVVAGQTIRYTVTVTAATGTNRSTAHDLVAVDTVPAGLTVVNAGVPVADGGTVSPDGGIWNAAARTITWNGTTTPATMSSRAPGASAALRYDAVVDLPATSGISLTNTVNAGATSRASNPTGERTTYTATANATVAIPNASITKSASPTTLTVGDTVTYTIDATVPAGVTTNDLTVLDVLPDGIDFAGFDPVPFVYTGTSTGCPSLAGAAVIGTQTANPDGSTTIGFFPGDLTAPAGNSCVVRMTYTARIDNAYEPEATPVVGGNTLTNSAQVYWNSANVVSSTPPAPPAPGGYAHQAGPATATVTVREPSVMIDKDVSQAPCDATPGNIGDNDDCATDIGTTVYTYTIRVTNASTTWPAHDVTVTDTPHAGLTAITVPPSGGAITVVDDTAPGLEWRISSIPASGHVDITYTARLSASATLVDGVQVTNTADVPTYFARPQSTRTADPAAEWRTYGQGGAGGDVVSDTVRMTVGFPHVTVDKTAVDDATDARAGVPFTWQIVATNTATEPTAAAYGIDLADQLPAGWVYEPGSSTITTPHGSATTDPTCTPSCATPGAELRWTDVVSGLAQPLNPGASVTIRFDAVPQSSLLAVGTTGSHDHVNTARATDAEDATGSAANADGDYTGPDDTASARLRRTDLSVTKVPSAGPYAFGSEVNWTITVANAGPDTATGVTVRDQLPAGLLYVTTVSASQGSFDSATGIWAVGALASGASATLVVRTRLVEIGTLTNRAEVQASHQWDADSTPNSEAAVADEDDDDTASVTAVATSIGDLVWFDRDGDATADPDEPGIPGVRLVLEAAGLDDVFGTADDFHGPDGVAGGADDITDTDVVTNATGFYGFTDLPTGRYRARVDTATLPGGTTPTFDDDATLDHASGIVTLSSNTGYLGADFGYAGTGSIGDRVWLDRDASGGSTQDPGEPGLSDVDVTLVWAGFDGDLATTADNVTYPVDTTDAAGAYLFTLLPAGPYRVSIDGTDLPAGTTSTYDLDGTATPLATVTSLTAGQARGNVDFSVAGTASIGDRVWFDRDGDGVQGTGEGGFAGIDLTVSWSGPDGLVGGGDDVVTSVTTDASGSYLVDHLPSGEYLVGLDSGDLPAGVEPTHDLDGIATPYATGLVLADGQDRTDVDFGARGTASIGDRVWFDLDGDGAAAPGPDDPGLAGVPVTATWAGPDLAIGTADDRSFTTNTGATGTYLVEALPYGPVSVTVDASALPGFEATFDGDGTASAHTVTLGLVADDVLTTTVDEANRRDADFAYTGTGSIGDVVWEDADADAVQDPTENGIKGIGMEVVWGGRDGALGTADDVEFTTDTSDSGSHVVDRLPAGVYSVEVVEDDLALGLVATHDLDGTTTPRTTNVTLTAGQNRTDVDFGERFEADLSLDKSHSGVFQVGQTGVYTLKVVNAGPAAAVSPRLDDVLPEGLTFVSAVTVGGSNAGTCSAVGQAVRCDLVSIAAGASTTVRLTVAVARAAAPGVTNTATVTSLTADPRPVDNTDSDPTEVPLADLQLTKVLDGSLARNETATYVLEATNLGPSSSRGPVVIIDDLPVGLEFVSATSTAASCTSAGQLVTCRSTAPLAVGQAVRVDLRVRVTAPVGSTIVNTASVLSDSSLGSLAPGDPVSSNNAAAAAATTGAGPSLPVTGWLMFQRWLQLATWAVGAGALILWMARRRRPTTT
jgi:uncharacterized repeat protein (TIGR01451 family)/fimbrial isopeptide formation D2 family protein